MADSMADFSTEVKFAQRLAANEKKIRDRAIKKLRKWLEVKSMSEKDGFTEADFLKIWKGLHYCLWMQDKPVIQEELAENISRLVFALSNLDAAFLFLRMFFQTEAREWSNIDRWRLDKFMALVRRVLHQSLVLLGNNGWHDDQITVLMSMLSEAVLNDSVQASLPDGLKIHLADIYLDELEKVGAEKLSADQVNKFLEPFSTYIATAKNTVIVKRVISRVFEVIIKQVASDKAARGEGKSDDIGPQKSKKAMRREKRLKEKQGRKKSRTSTSDLGDEVDSEEHTEVESAQSRGEIPPRLEYNFGQIADHLFKLGGEKTCPAKNRYLVYGVVKKLRDLEKGVLPPSEEEAELDTSWGITNKDINDAVGKLHKLQNASRKKRKRKHKKNKNADGTGEVTENTLESKEEIESDKDGEKLEEGEGDSDDSDDEPEIKRPKPNVSTGDKADSTARKLLKALKTSKKGAYSVTDVAKSNSGKSLNCKPSKNVVEMTGSKKQMSKLDCDPEVSNFTQTKAKKGKKATDKSAEREVTHGMTGDEESLLEQSMNLKHSAKKGSKKKLKAVKLSKSEENESMAAKSSVLKSAARESTPGMTENEESLLEQSIDLKQGSKKKLKAVKLFENEENQNMAAKSLVLKKKKRKSNTDLAEQKDVDVVIGDLHTGIVSADEKVKRVKKGKRKSVSTNNTTLGHADSVTNNVNTSLDSLEKCNMVEDGSAEEKIEIWVPNKKYKCNLSQSCNSSPAGSGQLSTGLSDSKKKKPESAFARFEKQKKSESAFARFEKLSKTPPAFVRRAVSKLSTPNTDPRKKASKKHKLDIADQTPGSGKHVSFNMKRNKALEFQDSLMFSPGNTI